ncbi:uncharacterized protein N7496_008853 [Penicillium cataractarum]|uniref:Uncharacterized protein n=1 Tax=Penicillium cataractarum TaxID=2100454 RepID=A0A9W9RZ75_9EURO|nr:uncharacterized protein N7496_008853 [Penicillium cataractarum]KAJ5369093.1 hypothetical protein N7496_008853 [Penicillium cataractarum]
MLLPTESTPYRNHEHLRLCLYRARKTDPHKYDAAQRILYTSIKLNMHITAGSAKTLQPQLRANEILEASHSMTLRVGLGEIGTDNVENKSDADVCEGGLVRRRIHQIRACVLLSLGPLKDDASCPDTVLYGVFLYIAAKEIDR